MVIDWTDHESIGSAWQAADTILDETQEPQASLIKKEIRDYREAIRNGNAEEADNAATYLWCSASSLLSHLLFVLDNTDVQKELITLRDKCASMLTDEEMKELL